MIKRALISVSDKTGIVEFAQALSELNIELLSTGGTFSLLNKHGISVQKVSDITQFPEILGGRVKSLHPHIHGGILAKRSAEHEQELSEHHISFIDYVIVNLYPFEKVVQKEDVEYDDAIENIDIGGPTMLRAAAKNHQFVSAIVDSTDYPLVISELKNLGDLSFKMRQHLALKAFQHTAHYDICISNYLAQRVSDEFPEQFLASYAKKSNLRYGENPHQKAAFYEDKNDHFLSIRNTKQLAGKELSYNNILDLDATLEILSDFLNDDAFSCIIKHTNPCGAAYGDSLHDAYKRAVACDPVSYFGGIVGLNKTVDLSTAKELSQSFLECIIAPEFSAEAIEILSKKKNLRLICFDKNLSRKPNDIDIRQVSGGLLVQESDNAPFAIDQAKTVSEKKVTSDLKKTLEFAWKLVKHVKSNAILFAKNGQTIGIGAGQMSRIDSTTIAKEKAEANGFDLKHSVIASDAFFPFRDSIDLAAKFGVSAIIQPGGSIRDAEVIDAANEHKMLMLFTETRHFKH